MTVKSVLIRPQGLRPGARAPTCRPFSTPLVVVRSHVLNIKMDWWIVMSVKIMSACCGDQMRLNQHRAWFKLSCVRESPRPRFQVKSLVGADMGSNPIRSHFCLHIRANKSLWLSVFCFASKALLLLRWLD